MDKGPPHKTRYNKSNRGESGEKTWTHGHRVIFPEPVAYALRTIIVKYDFIKWQSFCKAKDTVNKTEQ